MNVSKMLTVVVLLATSCLSAASIRVPQDQPTIQAGINAAINGDTVLVSAGTYVENITFPNHQLHLISRSGPDSTFIESDLSSAFLIYVQNADSASTLKGFSIGYSVSTTYLLIIGHAGGTVKRFNIIDNRFHSNGSDNMITSYATSSIVCSHNLITGSWGGAAIAALGPDCDVINNTVVGAGNGLAVYGPNSKILNNIVAGLPGYAIRDPHPLSTVDYNDFYMNGSDNSPGQHGITLNPRFVDPPSSNFSLDSLSPCIDAGDPNPIYNDPNGSRNDIGAISYVVINRSLIVPAGYPTIQDAINAAVDGDTVLVTDGVYTGPGNYDIVWGCKDILLISENGPSVTTIDCAGTILAERRAFTLSCDTDSSAVLAGFTIINGYRHDEGGAILLSAGSLTIRDCIFRNNFALFDGGALSCRNASATLISCQFDSNTVLERKGGGIFSESSSITIIGCGFRDNYNRDDVGAGICLVNSLGELDSSSFVGNDADHYGGAAGVIGTSSVYIKWCDFSSNQGGYGGAIVVADNASASIQWCLFEENKAEFFGNGFGGATWCIGNSSTSFLNCTFVENSAAEYGSAVLCQDFASISIDRSILAFNQTAGAVEFYPEGNPEPSAQLSCTDIFGNPGGDWTGPIISQYGINGNFSSNPMFCDTSAFDLSISESSPCAQNNNTCGVLIGARDVSCYYPVMSIAAINGLIDFSHIVQSQPLFQWKYLDPTSLYPQTAFEIAVGIDNDWQYAEMWNPAPFVSSDTFVVYNGAPLSDGENYWLRLRVSNSLGWSNWEELMFRMNSVPSVPQLRLPLEAAIVNTEHPTLVVLNPVDAEGDSLFFTFELSADNFASSAIPFEVKASNDSLTSFWVNLPLNEDMGFWWRVKASDYYEESSYSAARSFWVNAVNSAPAPFALIGPPNQTGTPLIDSRPPFVWQTSPDFDPGDSVSYTLYLSLDSLFGFVNQVSGLGDTSWTPASPLLRAQHYWWKVRANDKASGQTWSNDVFTFRIMRLGDPDGNGIVTISDAVYLIQYIFAGGPAPNPLLSGDADCNGLITISDAVYLINYIFAGGAAPCDSFAIQP